MNALLPGTGIHGNTDSLSSAKRPIDELPDLLADDDNAILGVLDDLVEAAVGVLVASIGVPGDEPGGWIIGVPPTVRLRSLGVMKGILGDKIGVVGVGVGAAKEGGDWTDWLYGVLG